MDRITNELIYISTGYIFLEVGDLMNSNFTGVPSIKRRNGFNVLFFKLEVGKRGVVLNEFSNDLYRSF